jgi:hypothetical protein
MWWKHGGQSVNKSIEKTDIDCPQLFTRHGWAYWAVCPALCLSTCLGIGIATGEIVCMLIDHVQKQKQTLCPESPRELYRPSGSRFSAKLVPTFADRGCHVVSVTDPYCRVLGFLYRSRYLFFQAALQLYSRGWVDPVPDPLILRKSGGAGNRTRASGSIARNSDH